MRRFWLENGEGKLWDLTTNTLDQPIGSFFADPDGLGIKTKIKSFEVENTTFIEEVNTQTATISGTLYFKDYQHYKRFVEFVGNVNTDKPMKLYYSIGEVLEKHWYKLVLISELKKGEVNIKTAALEVKAKFEAISMWKQDRSISIEIARTGDSLVYPYTYPYTYGGNNLAIDIDNTGNLPTSCVVKAEGLTDTPTFRVMQNDKIIDQAKYNLVIQAGSHLVIDSAPDTQKAILYTGENEENVYYTGEKDYTFSNFITIPTGKSTFVVSALNSNFGKVTLSYSIQRELV